MSAFSTEPHSLVAAAAGRPSARQWVVLTLAALVACGPVLLQGFPAGHDWPYELARVAAFRHAIADGQYPPFWADSLYGGFGSPIFLYYAPLFSGLAALLSWPLGSVPAGAAAALAGLSLIAAVGMANAVAAALGEDHPQAGPAGAIAGTTYVLSPYLLGDSLLRNANAEFAALCLAPLAFWGLFAIARRPRRGALILALGLALTVLAHNLTALVVTGMLGLAAMVRYWPPRRPRLVLAAGAGMALGLAMAAFFWVPALALKGLVQLDTIATGRFDFAGNFPPPHLIFGVFHFYSGGFLVPVAIACAAVAHLGRDARRWPERPLVLTMLALAVAFLILQIPLSTPVWRAIPFLELFQFPWRFNGPLALAAALLGGLWMARALEGPFRRAAPAMVVAGLAGLAVVNAVPHLSTARPLDPASLRQTLGDQSDAALVRTGHRATVLDEYLPRGADAALWRTAETDGLILTADPGIAILNQAAVGGDRTVTLTADRAGQVLLAAWAYPGWSVTAVEGQADGRAGPHGVIAVTVGPGETAFVLRRTPPPTRRIGLAVSIGAVVLWLALWAVPTGRRRDRGGA